MALGKAKLAAPELLIEFLQFAAHAELLEIVETDQNLNDLRIERRVDLHVI